MALADLQFKVANELSRQGSVFISGNNAGKVRDVEVNISPVNGEADTGGREKMLAADIEIQYIMQQTSDTEIGALPELLGEEQDVHITDRVTTDPSAPGRTFLNCLLSSEGGFNFMGEGSSFTFNTGGRVPTDALSGLASGGEIDFGA